MVYLFADDEDKKGTVGSSVCVSTRTPGTNCFDPVVLSAAAHRLFQSLESAPAMQPFTDLKALASLYNVAMK